MSQASPAKEPSMPSKEPSMEEILASIRRIIESGEERPALAQRTRERLAASAARSEAGRERAASGGFEQPATDEDDAPQRRLFAPANGVQRREFAAATRDVSAAGTGEPGVARSPDEAGAEARSAAFEAHADDAFASLAAGVESPDAAPDMMSAVFPQEHLRPGDIESTTLEIDAVPSSLAHANRVEPRAAAERERPIPAAFEAEPVDPMHASAPAIEPAEVVEETAHGMYDDAQASVAELPDFSLEFDEESFSAELRGEVAFALSAGERPDAGLAAALAEAADASAPAFSAPTSVIAETSSLMSAEAGAQVAAAFDDLAGAIRDGQMKSMEEMTRQMLRPMLQEWLDDNLPRLVEKLVREEIERVSRGGRR